MNRGVLRWVVLVGVLCGGVGAVAQEQLKVVGMYPLPGQPLTDMLVVYFNEEIAKPEAQDSAPLSFEPALTGRFVYGKHHIAFIPIPGAVRSRTVYKVALSNTIRSIEGKTWPGSSQTFTFPTHAVTFREALLTDYNESRYILALYFSDRLNSALLGDDAITIIDADGGVVKSRLAPSSDSGRLELELPRKTALPVSVTIQPGIPSADQRFVTTQPYTFRFPVENLLTIRSANWHGSRGAAGSLELHFSDAVDYRKIAEYVTLHRVEGGEPIPFKVATSSVSRRHQLNLDGVASNLERIDIRIREGLIGRGMKMVGASRTIPVRRTSVVRRSIPLAIWSHQWNNNGVNGVDLQISFSQMVSAVDMAQRLVVEPEVGGLEVKQGYYDQALVVRGDWKASESYRIRIGSAEAVEAEGTRTTSRVARRDVGKPPLASGVQFTHEDKYFFPRSKPGMLGVQGRNVEEVAVVVYRLFPNNLVPAMNYLRGENVNQAFNHALGRELGEKIILLSGGQDELVSAPMDLSDLLTDSNKGVFGVQLKNHRNHQNTKIVVWTDIGAVAYWQGDSLALYAHDLYTLDPLAGAKVTVHSHKNQVVASGVTGRDGILLLRDFDETLGSPRVATIETPDDFSFVELRTRDQAPDAFKPSMSQYDAEGYDSYIFSDRNIYRPGETVHFRLLVRTQYGDALTDVPLMFTVTNGQRQSVLSQPITLSQYGTGEVDLKTKATFATGQYMAQLQVPGSNRSLQTYTFNVEEFVPNNITAKVSVSESVWTANEAYAFEVVAENLFGGPAAQRKTEGSVILRKGVFESDRWKGYHFGNDADFKPIVHSLGEQQTDATGHARFSYSFSGDLGATSPIAVAVRGRVFELGGRTVTSTEQVMLFPSGIALGIVAEPTDNGRNMKVRVAAIQPNESPADLDTVTVTLEKQMWHYTIRRMQGRDGSWWERSYEAIDVQEVTLDEGQGDASFELPYYGQFRVRVHSETTPQYSTQSFHKYGSRVRLVTSAEPSLVTLSLDREAYQIGDTATLKIESPYPGRAIICLQGERIQELRTVVLENNRAEVRIPLLAGYAPNIWAEVTVVHEDGDGKTHPYSSFSVIDIPVNEAKRRLKITYPGLPEEVRPAQKVPVRIRVLDSEGRPVQAEISLAAVDEGIHTILRYRNPDPATWFERSRRPAFNRATYYDRVAYDFDSSEIGGGLMDRRLAEDSSVSENWIKPVALWSGTVETNADGFADVELDIPEFNGQLRLVAVAASAEACGSASKRLYVRRPYILRTSMPRFALPSDTFQCSAVLFNTTEDVYTARVHWTAGGSLEEAEERRELELAPGGERRVVANLIAGIAAGQGRIDWRVDIVDQGGAVVETLNQSALIPVLHPAVYQTDHELAMIMPGDARTFRNTQFVGNELASSEISVSANPVAQLGKALKYVVRYPYGCVEQTTSACMPLYLLKQHEELLDSALIEGTDVQYYLQSGIDRLFSMQMSSGGLGYWPGAPTPNAYGSVYACHFLSLVKDDPTLDVPLDSFKELQEYVARITAGNGNHSLGSAYRRAYATYVLALGGKVSTIGEIERFDSVHMPTTGRYLLAAALAMSTDDAARANTYLESFPMVDYETKETNGNFNSPIRGVAVKLLAMLEMGGDEEAMLDHVQKLSGFLVAKGRRNTQDMAFIATAMGRYFSRFATKLDQVEGTVTYGDTSVTVTGKDRFVHESKGTDTVYRVVNSGFIPITVNYISAGIPKAPQIASIREGIGISRTFRRSGGEKALETTFEHGGSYLATLTIECDQAINNLVVADLLPAGFEVANPRIDKDALVALNVPEQGVVASYVDVRDDRLVLAFDRLAKGTHQFHYVVRAVTPGVFQHPGVVAECMYDARLRGRSAISSVEIVSNTR